MVLLAISLLLALVEPRWAFLAALSGAVLLWLNRDFYRFLVAKKGLRFLLAAVPLHWLYYLNCAIAFPLGHLRYWWRRVRSAAGA